MRELLILEDDEFLAAELADHFGSLGWSVTRAGNLQQARRALGTLAAGPLVVLADLTLPDGSSLDLLAEVRQAGGASEWVFLTGRGGVPDSVRALRLGASDFLEKPCDLERLEVVIAGAQRSVVAQQRLLDLSSGNRRRYGPEAIQGQSPATVTLRSTLERLCGTSLGSVVLQGETGVGKGLVARILHHSGKRSSGPLEEVNCAALPKDLVESELFGHEAGAFTGAKGRHRGFLERASGGTLFLDEVSELPLDVQAKFLKAVEEKSVRRVGGERPIQIDVQFVAASNRSLEAQVAEGLFREDLYWRLNLFTLQIPPLRERMEDLDDLVEAFVAEFGARSPLPLMRVPDAVWKALRAHSWPGNVRELRNVLERCVMLSEGPELALEWLQLAPGSAASPEFDAHRLTLPLDGSMALDEMDRFIIESVLTLHGGNVAASARALGTTRETLRYRIQKYGLGEGE
jgi:DNA-binding NtrC family response regulator